MCHTSRWESSVARELLLHIKRTETCYFRNFVMPCDIYGRARILRYERVKAASATVRRFLSKKHDLTFLADQH